MKSEPVVQTHLCPVALSPSDIAQAYWELDAEQQAEFFAELERMAGHLLCVQTAALVHQIAQTNNVDAMNGFRTMFYHAEAYHETATDWRATLANWDITRKAKEMKYDVR